MWKGAPAVTFSVSKNQNVNKLEVQAKTYKHHSKIITRAYLCYKTKENYLNKQTKTLTDQINGGYTNYVQMFG